MRCPGTPRPTVRSNPPYTHTHNASSTQVRLILTDPAFDDPHDESGWEGSEADTDAKGPRVRSLPQAVTKLDAIMNTPPLYPRAVQFLCQIASAVGGTFVFWRGGVWDALIVAITTFVVALLVFPGSKHFFIAKVQVLACSIATGIVSTLGSTYLEAPCMRALTYAPVAFQFPGECSVVLGVVDCVYVYACGMLLVWWTKRGSDRRLTPTLHPFIYIYIPGWGLSLAVLEFSVGAPILGTTRMMNALVSALLIGTLRTIRLGGSRGSVVTVLLTLPPPPNQTQGTGSKSGTTWSWRASRPSRARRCCRGSRRRIATPTCVSFVCG